MQQNTPPVTDIVSARIAGLDESNADADRFFALQSYAQQHPENGLITSVMTLRPGEEIISSSLRHHNNHH
ncbi:hypothetical protein [Xenorhabdus cabanillasii]|uniref:Uncharacterized protein n=1 Tax=Xenorhabdus cabanillasii JM26 TaxID=1427517 RepID=W1JBV1_9GAMM|nr:hypothetical protein [Xenorhabdus cabanillasii]PHM76159.1 hypothetical protein Xcab_03364 [Xenorhabdus cabanillasii JM26]CDL87040.1 conserved hypothetical protein [Xenorhabdus cabanillasii JM26]